MMAPEMIRINLLPTETKAPIPKAYKHLASSVFVFLISLGTVGYVWAQVDAYYTEKKDEAIQKEKIANELEQYMKQVTVFKKTKADLEDKLDTITKLKDSQKGPLRLLTELRNRFPRQVWMSSIMYAKDNVTLKGFGLTLTTIGEFVENLQGSKYFSNVEFQRSMVTNAKGLRYYNFDIRFRFDADPERTKAEMEKKRKAEADKKRLEAEKKKQALEKKKKKNAEKKE